jgi:uncharacterized protein YdeI (YjbR/CyaY-like superfamily)
MMDRNVDTSRMKRPIHKMPDWLTEAIAARGLAEKYRERPAYQQNDYVYWITSPKGEATRQKRLEQMLDELETGGVYMRMKWNG